MDFSILKFLIASTILMSTSSFATNNDVLLQKIQHTGFVRADKAFALDCKIFANKVIVDFHKKGLSKNIEFLMNIDPSIIDEIPKAALGSMTSRRAPHDIGSKIYSAFQSLPNNVLNKIDLGSTEDGRYITSNSSTATTILKTYLDTVCENVLKM